ncbi:MAG: hypothetical protein BMS9Abin07_2363 [Acidimicrobiia bacterium]|nr:MAG: hypothetical protein BMS9Abin07_2363 [Acidimicrobiia bacterium]
MTNDAQTPDQYLGCEEGCAHDLARGVLVDELLGGDGPHPPLWAQSGAAYVLSDLATGTTREEAA